MQKKITLEDLGYDSFFDSGLSQLNLGTISIARVIVEQRGLYKVKNPNGEFFAKITGKHMFEASSREEYPAVGDWVAITELNDEQAVIHAIVPRKTLLKRKYINKNEAQIIGTNIDVAFVVESVDEDYSLNRFERYCALAHDGGIKPVIILNKIDLISHDEMSIKCAEIKNRFKDIDIVLTSAVNQEGLNELRMCISPGKTYCFLGSSGVGKSSLINALIGEDSIKTEAISLHTGKGKHTTTSREMYFLENGGIVIDNPGMREIGMVDARGGIDNFFDEVTTVAEKCKYTDCTHIHETGCAVLDALKSGTLDEDKYLNYVNLKKEADYYEMTGREKREKDRKFGKFVKTAKKQFKKYN